MIQTPSLPRCDCCGLSIVHVQVGEFCPQCHYPITVEKEEQFLEASLCDLQRAAHYGGTNLTVGDLIRRYQTRLNFLLQLKQKEATKTSVTTQMSSPVNVANPDIVSVVKPQQQNTAVPLSAQVVMPLQKQTMPQSVVAPAPMSQRKQTIPTAGSLLPLQAEPEKQPRTSTFSWRSFVVDQAITIIGLLGAFLILMGALSAVVTTSNRLASFLIVFGVHAFFGLVGVIAYRFASFRLISRIYVGIYAFLVPLVGFTVYSLIQGNYIQLTIPMLVAIASGYAAIVYFLLALYQRFPVFGYLGGMALIVADLATAQNLQLNFWWWPGMLMLLALPAITSVMYTAPGPSQFFKGQFAVLRQPVRTYMFGIVGLCIVSIILVALYSLLILDSGYSLYGLTQHQKELRFAILNMTVLLFLWTALFFWLTKRTQDLLILAYELLGCVLALCYAFNASPALYVVALTVTALLYHGLHHFMAPILRPFGNLGRNLDRFALVLVGIVPFVGTATIPLRLYTLAFHTTAMIPSLLRSQIYINVPVEMVALTIGCMLTISVVLYYAKQRASSGGQGWMWVLLLSGLLFTWEYSLMVVVWQIVPVWSFLALTLALMALAIIVRQHLGAMWSNPLEALVVGEALLTLVFSLGLDAAERSTLFLLMAAITYGIVLYQRRPHVLFVPLLLALAALPDLMKLPYIEMLLIGMALPLVAVVVHRFMPTIIHVTTETEPVQHTKLWEWPLLGFGLLCGIIVSTHDVLLSTSAVFSAFNLAFPAALEMAVLAGVWYMAAALARVRWWLVMAIAFAVGAVLLPSNSFWILVAITPAAALLAMLVSNRAGKIWAAPLYTVALLAACMSGVTAYYAHLYAASWILPGFGLLAYAIGVVEGVELCMWLLPLFVTWSVVDAAMIGDLYRPPFVVLAFTLVGVLISLGRHMPTFTVMRRDRFLRYALPFYTTALAAALLTGFFGVLHGANLPFYGAIPDALLIYACVAFAVVVYERQPAWLWSVALFGVWGAWLSTYSSVNFTITIALLAGVIGLGVGRVLKPVVGGKVPVSMAQYTWSWPWYLTSLVAMLVIIVWQSEPGLPQSVNFLVYGLLAFATLTIAIMLVERVPEALVLPAGLTALAIHLWQPALPITVSMSLYTLLCVLIFASQGVWKALPPMARGLPATLLHRLLGIGGQLFVVLAIIANGGLNANAGQLAFVGAGSLLVLSLLLFWYGRLQRDTDLSNTFIVQRYCDYGAGLLASLVVSWGMIAFQQANMELLLLPPATYLILIASLLMRDEALPNYHTIGQTAAVLGAACLLLPTLWLSFTNSDANLMYTLVLMGEALLLLLLGIGVRVRVFVLTGAGLIVVAALHALFLPSLGIPTYLVLTILGVVALALATILSLFGRRLQAVWQQWN